VRKRLRNFSAIQPEATWPNTAAGIESAWDPELPQLTVLNGADQQYPNISGCPIIKERRLFVKMEIGPSGQARE
jgi:hypothetical protein